MFIIIAEGIHHFVKQVKGLFCLYIYTYIIYFQPLLWCLIHLLLHVFTDNIIRYVLIHTFSNSTWPCCYCARWSEGVTDIVHTLRVIADSHCGFYLFRIHISILCFVSRIFVNVWSLYAYYVLISNTVLLNREQ